MRRALPALALVCAAALTAPAEEPPSPPAPVEVRSHAEPDTVTIGTRFRYVVEVTVRGDAEVLLSQPSEKIGEFDILDFGTEPPTESDGTIVMTRWYELVGYTPGHYLVTSPPVHYRLGGDELQEAPGREIRVSIESLLETAGDLADIRDIKGLEQPPPNWRPYYVLGAGVLGVLLLGLVVYRVLNRPKRTRTGPPPRPAHEIAATALARLRARRLIEQGAVKEYYSELSGIVRTYLEQRFRVRAPEMTTEEFLLASARDGRLAASHRRLLGDFLSESDLVKFARHLPTTDDSERAHGAAKRFVEETASQPTPRWEGQRAAG